MIKNFIFFFWVFPLNDIQTFPSTCLIFFPWIFFLSQFSRSNNLTFLFKFPQYIVAVDSRVLTLAHCKNEKEKIYGKIIFTYIIACRQHKNLLDIKTHKIKMIIIGKTLPEMIRIHNIKNILKNIYVYPKMMKNC